MSPLKPGTRVTFKNRREEGVLLRIEDSLAVVLLDEGLEVLVALSEVAPVILDLQKHLDIGQHPEFRKKKKQDLQEEKPIRPTLAASIPEIDLHAEKVFGPGQKNSKDYILERKMAYLEHQLQRLRARHIREAIIIHGVGQGILKEEVYAFLRKLANVQYFPADRARYGEGAVHVVFIYPKS